MDRKSKSIFIKDVECEICHIHGALQVLNPKTMNTNRIRHYVGLDTNKKPVFSYHKISKQYALKILAEKQAKPDQNISIHDPSLDLNLKESGLNIFTKNNYANALEKFS